MTTGSESGNRWEPTAGPTPAEGETAQYPRTTGQPSSQPTQPTPRNRRDRLRKRGVVGGVAAAVFLLGGAGGFALGQAAVSGDSAPRQAGDFAHHGAPGFDDDAGPSGPDQNPGFGLPPGPNDHNDHNDDNGTEGGSGGGTGGGSTEGGENA